MQWHVQGFERWRNFERVEKKRRKAGTILILRRVLTPTFPTLLVYYQLTSLRKSKQTKDLNGNVKLSE